MKNIIARINYEIYCNMQYHIEYSVIITCNLYDPLHNKISMPLMNLRLLIMPS